jgi:hypothetical protein
MLRCSPAGGWRRRISTAPRCVQPLGHTSYLLAIAYEGSLAEGLAAVLPLLLDLCPHRPGLSGPQLAPPPVQHPGSVPMPAPCCRGCRRGARPDRLNRARGWSAMTKPSPATTSPSDPAASGCSGTRLATRAVAAAPNQYHPRRLTNGRVSVQSSCLADPTVQGRMVHDVTKPLRT